VIDEVKAARSSRFSFCFIDEAHTLDWCGGGQAGSGDCGQSAQPALARGELRTIAHHRSEYNNSLLREDPALRGAFSQSSLPLRPSISEAVTILRCLAPVYEKSHGIYLRDMPWCAAAELSARYLAGRNCPTRQWMCWTLPAPGCASAWPRAPDCTGNACARAWRKISASY